MKIDEKNEYVITLIMAAGKGTRMKSNKSKLVHKIYDKELIRRVVDVAKEINSDEIVAVVGYLKEQVQDVLHDEVQYAIQEKLLGTGHAVMQAEKFLKGKKGKALIICGDVPALKPETLINLIRRSIENEESATILTAIYDHPTGYGRIIRDESENIEKIVEEKDATNVQKKIKEIDSGICCFDIEELLNALPKLTNENAQGEYCLTDVIKIMKDSGLKIGAMVADDSTEILGVNDKMQLELVTSVLRNRINTYHMKNGVTIENSSNTSIYDDVKIGADTIIHPNTIIKSGVIIGENCEIGPNAFIREGCVISNNVKIGNCVEIKNAKIGYGSKVPHLTYLGDCVVGENVNVGCGTITCNYDGKNKNKTQIGDNVFVGSNVNFVAPVQIGNDVVIGAGSTITENIPDNSLAIARERQINKDRK